MNPILILYATREGQTRRIAEHLAATVRARGRAADVIDCSKLPADFSLKSYSGAILAASVHMEKHEPEMVRFVKRNRQELEAMPTVFLSVSLSEAGAEDMAKSAEDRAKAAADAEGMIRAFLDETGWHPSHIRAVAGALLYSKYNFLVRFAMRMIARKVGAPTDTSRDYEFTDWEALDRLVDEVVAETG
jgi:menaquinone-dependent protoporphyrinogen oxidase